METIVQSIPLNKLKPSPRNVRKTGADAGIDELASSIAAHGLLQTLVVTPERNGEGAETGYYLVVAGERRRKALKLLAKQKKLARNTPIECHVRADGDASELSLAENVVRMPMHPADQFEAFAGLHKEGLGLEEIAARFGVTSAVVRQRLKLAAVSPKLIARYRESELSLEQLMAFAITDDHARQEEAFEQLAWNKSPEMIRRQLTTSHVHASDRRARFVGAEAYEAEGGVVIRDLFTEDGGGYFADSALLDRLALEKLEALAAELREESWRWVEAYLEHPYGYVHTLRRVYPDAEGAYAPEDIERAGVIVSLGQGGEPRIERGFVRSEDEPRELEAVVPDDVEPEGLDEGPERGQESQEGQGSDDALPAEEPSAEEAREDTALPALSSALVEKLTAERTAALQASLAANPQMALAALAHALALQTFYGRSMNPETCLKLETDRPALSRAAPAIDESRAGGELMQQHEAWARRMPKKSAELWTWILEEDEVTRLSLAAYCVARTIDAVHRSWEGRTRGLRHADALAEVLTLDMAAWWEPTRERYLNQVPKARILEAVREGVSEKDAASIAGLKKEAMIVEAERLLKGSRWLPELLRAKPSDSADKSAAAE